MARSAGYCDVVQVRYGADYASEGGLSVEYVPGFPPSYDDPETRKNAIRLTTEK